MSRSLARAISTGVEILLLICLSGLASGCAVTGWLTDKGPKLDPPGPEGLAARIAAEGDKPNGTVDHFAVLIGANTELRHRGNLSMAYQVLVEQGYEREDIYILDSEGESTFFPATDVTTRDTVRRLFAHLRRIVEPEDTLLIYVTGHGRRVMAEQDSNGARSTLGVSTIHLNSAEEISDWELSGMLDGLNPRVGIGFFDQCYGAIFATTVKSCNFVFITAAAEDETSYGVTFPRAFWGAFRAQDFAATPLSVKDAYEIARAADRGTQRGYNRPSLTQGCVAGNRLTLLGDLKPESTILSVNTPPAAVVPQAVAPVAAELQETEAINAPPAVEAP